MQKSLIDAGPLIALFDRSDDHHARAVGFMRGFNGRLVTSWAVITEVMYMLDFNLKAQMDLLKWIERDALEIPSLSKSHTARIIALMEKYRDVPMDFADATLMAMSETEKISEIITIDSDFRIYRNMQKEMLKNIYSFNEKDPEQ